MPRAFAYAVSLGGEFSEVGKNKIETERCLSKSDTILS